MLPTNSPIYIPNHLSTSMKRMHQEMFLKIKCTSVSVLLLLVRCYKFFKVSSTLKDKFSDFYEPVSL